MRHAFSLRPHFYMTSRQACPYIEGRVERKLFTPIEGDKAHEINDLLSRHGFRRSQNVIYRPSCADCAACLSARINAQKFSLSKSQKRIMRKNQDLRCIKVSSWASEEQYDLFQRYLAVRHVDGGMADMNIQEFAAMMEQSPIESHIFEYRDAENVLRGVALTDSLSDGLSMVYSFFCTSDPARSLGTYMILNHIYMVQNLRLPYVYLGYWVQGSPKMDYKVRFSGLEIYYKYEWQEFDKNAKYEKSLHPLSVSPISEQLEQVMEDYLFDIGADDLSA